jgi:hypothetical protein
MLRSALAALKVGASLLAPSAAFVGASLLEKEMHRC